MGQSTYNTTVSQMGASNHWPLTDGAVTSFSDAIGSATLTASTAPATATGPDGSATGAYINNVTNAVLTAASFSWPEDWTMAWWQNCDATMTGDLMAWEWNQSAFAKYVQLDAGPSGSNMTLSLYYGTPGAGATAWSAAKSSFGTSSWKFCTVSYKRSTNTLTLYIDGSSVGSQTTSNTQNSGAPGSGYLGIGGRNNAGTRGLAFDGALNGVALFASVLTSTQVGTLKQAMTGPVKTFTADMVVNPPPTAKTFTADMDISSNRTTKTFTADLTIARVSVTGDTFLEAGGSIVNLSSHTPSGPVAAGTWSSHPASGISSVVAASSGKYVAQDDGTSLDLNSATPSSADYEVEATVTVMATAYSCRLLARWDTTATTGYTAFIDTNNTTGAGTGNKLVIGKHVAGTFTVIGTPYTIGTLAGPYRLRLRCSGTTISAWLDGTQRVSVTDSSISAVGKAGLGVTGAGNTTSFRLSDFAVYTGFTNTTTAAFTADMAIVDLTKTKTFTADLVIRGAVTKTFTANLGVGNRITATSSSQSGAAQTAVSDTGAADSLNYNSFNGLCRMPNGNLLLAYHAGNDHTGSTSCKIKARVGVNNGDGTYTWGSETTLATSAGSNLADVGCVTLANGDVMVTWNDSSTPGHANVNTVVNYRYRKSSDNGATWATAVSQAVPGWATTVTAGNAGGAYAIAPCKPVQIPAGQPNAGRLLLATYGWDNRAIEDGGGSFSSHEYVKCMASDDNGATWTQLSIIFPDTAGTAYDETDLLICDDGSVLAACRQITGSGTGCNIITRRSTDGGVTWNTATIVLGTSSSTGYGGRPDMIQTANGGILLRFRYMNAGSSSWTGYRLSTDRGQSWAAPDVDPYDGTTGRTGAVSGTGRGPDIYGAFALTAPGANTVAYAWCEETNPGTGTRCIIYFRTISVVAQTSATFTADMVIASSTATQRTKTFTASLQVVIVGATKTFTADMEIISAVIPPASTLITHNTYTVAGTGGLTVTTTGNQVTVADISDTSPIPA